MKLLRVLETGRFERLGSNRERQVKVRVISATNADLQAMIRAGTFREDLFYRLNVIELRCRRWPSAPTTSCRWREHFLGGRQDAATPAREAALLAHAWPGNVRELKNVMAARRPAGQGRRRSRAADLGLPLPRPRRRRATPSRTATRSSRRCARAGGVIAQAAAELGLSRQALYRRMERLGIARAPR